MRAKVTLKSGAVVMGDIVSKRYAPPNFAKVAAYSIMLDSKKGKLNYHGSVFGVDMVEVANES